MENCEKSFNKKRVKTNIALQLTSIQQLKRSSVCSLYCRIFHPASWYIGLSLQRENYSGGLSQLYRNLFLSLLELLKSFKLKEVLF